MKKKVSKVSKKGFHISHDEEKILLFITGIIQGFGITAAIFGAINFTVFGLITLCLVLILIESRKFEQK